MNKTATATRSSSPSRSRASRARRYSTSSESQGENISKATVRVEKHRSEGADQANDLLRISLWGGKLPGAEIDGKLKNKFPFLSQAQITIAPMGEDELTIDISPENLDGKDSEAIKKEILEKLKAQGHEGAEVHVIKTDGEHDGTIGKHVEIAIEKAEELEKQ